MSWPYILASENVMWEDTSEYYLVYENVEDPMQKRDKKKVPKEINYKLHELRDEEIYEKWYLKEVRYWKDYNEVTDTYSNLHVKELITYNRDEDNLFIINREKQIIRYKENGDSYVWKTKRKKLNRAQSLLIDKKAREYVLVQVKYDCIGLLALTEVLSKEVARATWMPFVSWMTQEMTMFIDWDRQPLIDAVNANTTYPWLENDTGVPDWQGWSFTIRQYVIYSISP